MTVEEALIYLERICLWFERGGSTKPGQAVQVLRTEIERLKAVT